MIHGQSLLFFSPPEKPATLSHLCQVGRISAYLGGGGTLPDTPVAMLHFKRLRKYLWNVYGPLVNIYAPNTIEQVSYNCKLLLLVYLKSKDTVNGVPTTLPPE
jgi:hypothetical protein